MRNQLTLDALIRELQMNCGDDLAACKAVGVSLMFVNQWRKDDKDVHEKLAEAARVGTQGLVSAAIQRAVRGVEEDVYFKGAVVGQKTVYSDGLLQTLLKAKVPEFAKPDGDAPQVTVNIANVMPRASSYQEWLEQKNQTATHMDRKALPKPVPQDVIEQDVTGYEVLDADFEVQQAFGGIEL